MKHIFIKGTIQPKEKFNKATVICLLNGQLTQDIKPQVTDLPIEGFIWVYEYRTPSPSENEKQQDLAIHFD